jgi:hypothetical protein
MSTTSSVKGLIASLVCTQLLSGCASAIYATGKDGDVLCGGSDRAAIIQRFGEPIERRTDKFGRDCEVFRAKGKIAPKKDEIGDYMFGEVMTFGLGDILWTPLELMRWPFLANGKKDVYVGFDDNGKYLYHFVRHAKSRPSKTATALPKLQS